MKNKIFSFVLDLFKNGDKEEPAGIFAQVKIYRSTSARVFEFIVGILVLCHMAAHHQKYHSCHI